MTIPATKAILILRLAFLASVASLAAAYIAQLGFGLHPCHLCLLQRIPFAVVMILSLTGLLTQRWQQGLIVIIGVVFLINSGIAGYHTATEQHWIAGPSGCTQEEAPANQSADDFLKHIQSAPIVACDQPQWEFHGITMAGINMIWCLVLAISTFVALRQPAKKVSLHA